MWRACLDNWQKEETEFKVLLSFVLGEGSTPKTH